MPKKPKKIARTYWLPIELVERMEKVYSQRDRSLTAFVVNAITMRIIETELMDVENDPTGMACDPISMTFRGTVAGLEEAREWVDMQLALQTQKEALLKKRAQKKGDG